MHDATKRFEIETLLKAGLPKARVVEIAGVSVHSPKCPVNCATGSTPYARGRSGMRQRVRLTA